MRQRVWFDENHKELLEKYRGKWIALHKCNVVAVAEDDLALCEEIDEKGIKKSEVYISPVLEGTIPDGASLVLPIDAIDQPYPTGSLTYESISHPREYRVEPGFINEGQFKKSPYNNYTNCRRPVLSTLVPDQQGQQKIISFLVDTGSPWSFLSARTCVNLGLLKDDPEFLFDAFGFDVLRGHFWNKTINWRLSKQHWEEINILGCDVIYIHPLHIDYKRQILSLE